MKNCIFYSLVLTLLFLIGSCKDSDDNKTTGATYDPNQPVTVESFMPVDGKLREKVIVKGSNFGKGESLFCGRGSRTLIYSNRYR